MVTKGLDREQRQAKIRDATSAIVTIEEAFGTAVLENDEGHMSSLRGERDHQRDLIEDERAAIAVLDQRIAEAEVKDRERATERQRMELYELTAEMLPVRARMLRTQAVFLEAQKTFQALSISSRLTTIRNKLVQARVEYEYPGGMRSDGGNDPEQVQAEAQRFLNLAAEIRRR